MSYTEHFTPETLSRPEVDATTGPLVLEFGTNWCGHCQRAQPGIAQVMQANAVPHVKVEDGPGRPLGRSFRVKLWPTFIVLHNGQEVARVVRPTTANEVSRALDALR